MKPAPILFYESNYYMLSNWSAHMVELDGVLYTTAEHAYHCAKFTDPGIQAQIRAATSPKQAKTLANETHAAARRHDWNDISIAAMERVLRAKTAQHAEVREALHRSGTAELVEDSPVDAFWGRGPDHNGHNHLGRLWMKIRAELASQLPNPLR